MDHVTVYVTELEAGTAWWSALLAPLGWEVGERDAEEVTLRGPHGTRPHYGAGYYAAFVLDAHGNNLEAVQCRE